MAAERQELKRSLAMVHKTCQALFIVTYEGRVPGFVVTKARMLYHPVLLLVFINGGLVIRMPRLFLPIRSMGPYQFQLPLFA